MGGVAYHALDVQNVLDHFEVDTERGLTVPDVDNRLNRHGLNQLREAHTRGTWRILLEQFKSVVILIMVVADILAFATARWPEAIALAGVIIVNTLIGFFSEQKAEKSMKALRQLSQQESRVRRNGQEEVINAENLVPGDVVLIGPEELVPADLRVIHSDNLRINEAALTGESVSVHKQAQSVNKDTPLAERTSMIYKGTTVTEGFGEGVAVATGMDTELGHISRLADQAEQQATPLQQRLDRLGHRLAWLTLTIAVIVAVVGLTAGRPTMLMIETAIALGVAAVPEGLPIVATIALARGMWLMARRNALVNRLTAVETLGATRVIFTDKTGTLTQNRMTVRNLVTAMGTQEIDDQQTKQTDWTDEPLLSRLAEIGVLCNNATLHGGQNQSPTGDPTEIALLELGAEFQISRDTLLEELPEEREVSFDPDVMMMGTFHREETQDGWLVAVKGSPESVLQACSRVAKADGDHDMTSEERQEWQKRSEDMAKHGLRLLAAADKHVSRLEDEPYGDLRFVGIIGMADPPRVEVPEAVRQCQRAGIRVVMVTGDRPDTGQAIAEQVGLASDGGSIHGSELPDLEESSEKDRKSVMQANVFARVTPEQKLRLMEAFQSEGEIVAMTGDGVNDAPALRQADIGVAMGKRGTDAAKQMADMVLRDDKFSTIVAAVEQGRIIFANIRKSVIFMLCTNLAEILAVTVTSLAHLPIALSPLQILFLNVLTDVFPALALGVGPGSNHVMDHPPRRPEERVLTRHHWIAIAGWSTVIGICVLTALSLARFWLDLNDVQSITVSFLTLGFAKLWFVLNLRDRGSPIWDNDVVRNPWIWAAIALCVCLLLLTVSWPLLGEYLPTENPGTAGWFVILVMSAIPALLSLLAPGISFYASSHPTEAPTMHNTESGHERRSTQ